MRPKFSGIISPFITPFNEDLSIDVEAVKWLARYEADGGVHGIFPNSTTGEFIHLKPDEVIELTKAVIESVGGKVKVIPGISANCTLHSIELGRELLDLGVDGFIITPPYYFKVSKEGLKKHFSMVAEALDTDIIIYNIPSTTGINIPIDLYVELAKEYSNIVGAKITHDSLIYLKRLIYEVKAVRKDFVVLTGMADYLLPNLMLGGDGGVLALANIYPQIPRNVYDAWFNRDLMKALNEYRRLLQLAKIYEVASSFPTAIKTALKVMGAPVKPYVRPPLTMEPKEVEEKIRKILVELGIVQ